MIRWVDRPTGGSTLGELETLAGSGLTGFFPFTGAGIAGKKAGFFEGSAERRITFFKSAGQSVGDGTGLTVEAAAGNADKDVKNTLAVADEKGSKGNFLERFGRKIAIDGSLIDNDFSGTRSETDSSNGGFAAADGHVGCR